MQGSRVVSPALCQPAPHGGDTARCTRGLAARCPTASKHKKSQIHFQIHIGYPRALRQRHCGSPQLKNGGAGTINRKIDNNWPARRGDSSTRPKPQVRNPSPPSRECCRPSWRPPSQWGMAPKAHQAPSHGQAPGPRTGPPAQEGKRDVCQQHRAHRSARPTARRPQRSPHVLPPGPPASIRRGPAPAHARPRRPLRPQGPHSCLPPDQFQTDSPELVGSCIGLAPAAWPAAQHLKCPPHPTAHKESHDGPGQKIR